MLGEAVPGRVGGQQTRLPRRATGLQRGNVVGNDLSLIGEAAFQRGDLVGTRDPGHDGGQRQHRDQDHTDHRDSQLEAQGSQRPTWSGSRPRARRPHGQRSAPGSRKR